MASIEKTETNDTATETQLEKAEAESTSAANNVTSVDKIATTEAT